MRVGELVVVGSDRGGSTTVVGDEVDVVIVVAGGCHPEVAVGVDDVFRGLKGPLVTRTTMGRERGKFLFRLVVKIHRA